MAHNHEVPGSSPGPATKLLLLKDFFGSLFLCYDDDMTEAIAPYHFSDNNTVPVKSIQLLRQSVGWIPDSEEVWQETLDTALGVALAWKEEELVGIGFLVGTKRHAVLCDLAVSPDHQRNEIGRHLVTQLMDVAQEKGVRYTTLYYDEAKPWLTDFYQSLGFQSISNAMQHVNLGPISNK